MIDHLTLTVRNRKKSRDFYLKVLKPLGYGVKMDSLNFTGFGDKVKPYFSEGGSEGRRCSGSARRVPRELLRGVRH